jgi:4,5-dihydroxyphthalate decarboxylase
MAAKKKAKKAAKKKTATVKKGAARKAPARKAAKKAAPTKAAAKQAAPKAKRAAGKLRLTMMTGGYEIVRVLQDGTVQPKGIELVIGGYAGTRGIHDQVAQGKGCDINEYNGGHYVVQKAHGRSDITAIPVFLHRRFRHGFIYINTNKGITQASDLAGRRVACRSIGAAAAYWMRGHLEEHGAPHRSITWVIQDPDDASEGAPESTKIEVLPKGKNVEEMILTGEVDAIIMPNVSEAHAKGDPRIARLWPNYKEVELDYYRRTGFFPIMHVTTVPTEIVAKYPWVVESLTLAFEEAKQLAMKRVANPRNVPLAFWRTYWEEERAMLGDDPWQYGMSDLNKRNYDTLVGFVHDQVLDGPRPKLEELFAKESFQLELPLPKMHEIKYDF